MRLTDIAIRRLPLPGKKGTSKIHYDDDVKGFGARVTANGARSFVLNYVTRSGRERRYTIGDCGDWTTTDARNEAKRLRSLIDQGGDPLADIEAERSAPTVAALIARFREEHFPRLRASTREDYEYMLQRHVIPHFGEHIKVADVTFANCDALHRKITKAGHKYRANRVLALCSKMFTLAIRWQMRTDNPCKGVERNTEHSRLRYLSAAEMARLMKALAEFPDQDTADIFRVLLLTGARRGEVLAMKWADLDITAGTWTKLAQAVKGNRTYEALLSAPLRQLLSEIEQRRAGKRSEYVFPGNGESGHISSINRAWKQLKKSARITGLRVHDLRHSFASELVSGGASLPLIGSLLGHRSVQTTQRYAHLYPDAKREAIERVGAAILNAGKPAAEPVPLRGQMKKM